MNNILINTYDNILIYYPNVYFIIIPILFITGLFYLVKWIYTVKFALEQFVKASNRRETKYLINNRYLSLYRNLLNQYKFVYKKYKIIINQIKKEIFID